MKAEDKSFSNRRILIVDDNISIHDDYKKILEKEKEKKDFDMRRSMLFGNGEVEETVQADEFEFDSCYQGEEAVQLVRDAFLNNNPYAVAFVDCRMPPGIDGIETISRIWEIDRRVQVVFCTAFSDYGMKDIQKKLGITDSLLILKKPFDSVEIKQLATALIKKWNIEKRNRYLRNYMKSIIDSMPSIIIGIDSSDCVTHWNRQIETETGVKEGSAVGRPLKEVFTIFEDNDNEIYYSIVEGKTKYFPRVVYKKDGKTRYKDILIYPIQMKGNEEDVVIRIDDVTEIENKEAQLRQAQKMETVGNLAGGLAHDFNNMLGGVKAAVSMLYILLQKDRSELDIAELVKFVTLAEKSTNRATEMVSQLLELSKKQELSFEAVEINSIVKDVVKLSMNSFEKSIEIVTSYHEERATIYADSIQIEQVLLNLCINAGHAMTIMRDEGEPEGGTLSIAILKIFADDEFIKAYPEASKQNYWRIEVRDTGVGMSSDIREKIFDPFFTTKEERGTGLGLAMVNNIVVQHKGFIDISSEVGKGTVFSVYFPVLESGEKSREESVRGAVVKGSGKILIIDDDELIRFASVSLMKACGYTPIPVENGKMAVEVFSEKKDEIKAVILDLSMPGMNSREVFIAMNNIKPGVKVLLTSGYNDDSRIENIISIGAAGFLQKPFSVGELSVKLDKIINE